ncbi:hypothetical protein RRG08_009216 [Elysia crispata]|uniref:Uncharacterized protein n=1 Tax=Elysia crispata TaxID=231223 RepID=A0AAE0YM89_9GAST|nr:hypothetical protein RRG08_009216 [Elysia crispata]
MRFRFSVRVCVCVCLYGGERYEGLARENPVSNLTPYSMVKSWTVMMRCPIHFCLPQCKVVLLVVAIAFLGYTLFENGKRSNQLSYDSYDALGSLPHQDNKKDRLQRLRNDETWSSHKVPIPSLRLLTSDLRKKLKMLQPEKEIVNMTTACNDYNIDYQDICADDVCPQKILPESLKGRIEQLAFRPNLQVPKMYREVLAEMAAAIPGYYDVIMVSALSSNHYMEAQAMFKDLHEKVLPVLKNFTFVVYDLGLKAAERDQVRTYCRCTFLPFPFEKFPEYFQTLKCFAWKVTVIRAMYERANLVMWTDTSIRYTNPEILLKFMERARERGIQQRLQPFHTPNPYHTLTQMFGYFGDSPCAHMAFHQVETGFGLYHKEPLVQHVVLDPWYGCAVHAACICPVEQKSVQICPDVRGSTKIGVCMRNEQSAISLILAKVFREKYRAIVVRVGSFQKAMREQKYPYFKELRQKKAQISE